MEEVFTETGSPKHYFAWATIKEAVEKVAPSRTLKQCKGKIQNLKDI